MLSLRGKLNYALYLYQNDSLVNLFRITDAHVVQSSSYKVLNIFLISLSNEEWIRLPNNPQGLNAYTS